MQERVVHFYSEGSKLEADYYLPDDLKSGDRRHAIVLCHGYSGVRSVIFRDYAQYFADAGYPTLGFDYRGFGGSEGIKWRIIASEQLQDIRNAVTWIEAQGLAIVVASDTAGVAPARSRHDDVHTP